MNTAHKKYTIFQAAAVAAVLLFTMPAFAQNELRSPLLNKFEEAGGSVEFIGSSHGLDGWVAKDSKGEVKQTVYTTQDGAMVVGKLISPDGELETKTQLEAYLKRTKGSQDAAPGAEKSSSKSEQLYAKTEQAGWVGLGKDDVPYIYIFMNVTCDHCQNFWKDIEDYVTREKLQVRLVPYGKSDENRDGGAALLAAADPLAAWKAYLTGNKDVLSKDKATEESYKQIDMNNALVAAYKLGGPPFTLYRRPGDGTLAAIVGRPDNVMLMMAELIK